MERHSQLKIFIIISLGCCHVLASTSTATVETPLTTGSTAGTGTTPTSPTDKKDSSTSPKTTSTVSTSSTAQTTSISTDSPTTLSSTIATASSAVTKAPSTATKQVTTAAKPPSTTRGTESPTTPATTKSNTIRTTRVTTLSTARATTPGTTRHKSTPGTTRSTATRTTTPKPTPGRSPPNLGGKTASLPTSLKFDVPFNDSLENKGSETFKQAKTSLEKEIGNKLSDSSFLQGVTVTLFKKYLIKDNYQYPSLRERRDVRPYTEQGESNATVAEFDLKFKLKDISDSSMDLATEIMLFPTGLKSVTFSQVSADEKYIETVTKPGIKEVAKTISNNATRAKLICDQPNVCRESDKCKVEDNKPTCVYRCASTEHDCKGWEDFPGSNGLSMCYVNDDSSPECGCKTNAYNTGAKCLNRWWIIGPAAGGGALLILIFIIVIAVLNKGNSKKKDKFERYTSEFEPHRQTLTPDMFVQNGDDRIPSDDKNLRTFTPNDQMDNEPRYTPVVRCSQPEESPYTNKGRNVENYPERIGQDRYPENRKYEALNYNERPVPPQRQASPQVYENKGYSPDEEGNYYTKLINDDYRDFEPTLSGIDTTTQYKIKRPSTVKPYAMTDIVNSGYDVADPVPSARF